MTVLVTGAAGQLGLALRPLLTDALWTHVQGPGEPQARGVDDGASTDVRQLDITSRSAVEALAEGSELSAIVNAAAWTAVDAAESSAGTAWDVNATGVANLALLARRLDVPFVQLSTDYVLRGAHLGDAPVDEPLDPLGVYGITKAAGELAARLAPRHYVVRTSWVFGDGANFVRTMRALAGRESLSVVDDQVGRPTYAVDLALAVVELLGSGKAFGTYHATGSGPAVSWAGFARAVLADTAVVIEPTTTEAYAAAAPRPLNSCLEPSLPMRDWREALADYLAVEGVSAVGS